MHAVGHVGRFKLADQLIHHGLHDTRSIGAGNIAVQPALGMRERGDRVLCAANDKAGAFQCVNQRLNTGLFGDIKLRVGTYRKTDEAIRIVISNVTQCAHAEYIENALCARLDGPQLVSMISNMQQDTRLRMRMIFPHAKVTTHGRMHVLEWVRATGFDRFAYICHFKNLQNSIKQFLLRLRLADGTTINLESAGYASA